MALTKDEELYIDIANPHTKKKFELIEEYVKGWAPKLLGYKKCDGVVFIDCMCNRGVYHNNNGEEVFGTPIRVANVLSDIMKNYPAKEAWLYFNDLSEEKTEVLKTYLPSSTDNFHIIVRSGDGNDELRKIASNPPKKLNINYLVFYDPYTASIDWMALRPFLKKWGEVIINHMVSDSIRGVPQAKREITKERYEMTYLASIEELASLGSDRKAYEERIQKIMMGGVPDKRYFIASFPFFNTKNALIYNLIHGSSNIEGFKLFKKLAWKTFGGKSSSKNTHGNKNTQLVFDGFGGTRKNTDNYCYDIQDIAHYLHSKFIGRENVSLQDIWRVLDEHPVFPSDGFRQEIKECLKKTYNDVVSNTTITFTDMRSLA